MRRHQLIIFIVGILWPIRCESPPWMLSDTFHWKYNKCAENVLKMCCFSVSLSRNTVFIIQRCQSLTHSLMSLFKIISWSSARAQHISNGIHSLLWWWIQKKVLKLRIRIKLATNDSTFCCLVLCTSIRDHIENKLKSLIWKMCTCTLVSYIMCIVYTMFGIYTILDAENWARVCSVNVRMLIEECEHVFASFTLSKYPNPNTRTTTTTTGLFLICSCIARSLSSQLLCKLYTAMTFAQHNSNSIYFRYQQHNRPPLIPILIQSKCEESFEIFLRFVRFESKDAKYIVFTVQNIECRCLSCTPTQCSVHNKTELSNLRCYRCAEQWNSFCISRKFRWKNEK